MTKNTEFLGKNDVIKVDENQKGLMPHTIFTVDDFTSRLKSIIKDALFQEFLTNGFLANVLVPGKSWRKGKVRLTIEFIPDENTSSESPLDEFRNK